MALQSFRELIAWQKSIVLVTEVFRVTRAFPREEQYGLTAQIRRAAVSIPSNIAEGQGRGSTAEFRHFLCIARGSAFELETQIVIADNLGFISHEDSQRLQKLIIEIAKIINGLINSLGE